MRVEHVTSLAEAKLRLDLAQPIAEAFRRDPVRAIRNYEVLWIYQALENAFSAYTFIHPAFGPGDEIYQTAKSELARAEGYVRELARAVKEHPDSRSSFCGHAFAMGEAVAMLSGQLAA